MRKPYTARRAVATIFVLLTMACVVAVVFVLGPQFHYYAHVVAEAEDGLTLSFLNPGRTSISDCEHLAAGIARVFNANCPTCAIKQSQCLKELDAAQERLFTTAAIDVASARLRGGVVTYVSRDPALATAACRESERQAQRNGEDYRVTCFLAYTARPLVNQQLPPIDTTQISFAAVMALLGGVVSFLICYLLIRYEHLHARWSHDPVASGPQKHHTTPTPRIGGIALLIGLLAAHLTLFALQKQFPVEYFGFMLLAVLPAFSGGLVEDITKTVGVSSRLALTMLAAALGAWMLGAVLPRVDIIGIDSWLQWAPLAFIFTVFAVGGVGNSINIIDGYNGLAGGYAILALAALAWVSAQVGDVFLLTTSLTMMGALAGFLLWNYPRGRIFLGDSGAYLIGFWLAEISVLLVVRHPEVSAWFPLLLLIYPVFETLFSMARRKLLQGTSPGEPDDRHLHQLIYRRLLRARPPGEASAITCNRAVAPYIWSASLCCCLSGMLYWQHTGWLMIQTLASCVAYVWTYLRLNQLSGTARTV